MVVKFEDLKTDLIGEVKRMLDFVKLPNMGDKLTGRKMTFLIALQKKDMPWKYHILVLIVCITHMHKVCIITLL